MVFKITQRVLGCSIYSTLASQPALSINLGFIFLMTVINSSILKWKSLTCFSCFYKVCRVELHAWVSTIGIFIIFGIFVEFWIDLRIFRICHSIGFIYLHSISISRVTSCFHVRRNVVMSEVDPRQVVSSYLDIRLLIQVFQEDRLSWDCSSIWAHGRCSLQSFCWCLNVWRRIWFSLGWSVDAKPSFQALQVAPVLLVLVHLDFLGLVRKSPNSPSLLQMEDFLGEDQVAVIFWCR